MEHHDITHNAAHFSRL